MKSEDYSQGDTFQTEKRTVFSTEALPLCAEGQLARPGDFVSATVGGWSVFAARDKEGAVRVLRNACRHQNMKVVATPAGNCETFRCRFHGWTYDLQGRFLSAPRCRDVAGLRRHAGHRHRLQLEGPGRASAGRAHAVGRLHLGLALADGA